jgi:hypothetical protein
MKRREEIALLSWQTRQLATYIAAGYMTDGKGNPALDSAQTLAYDDIERAQIEEALERDTRGGSLVWGKNENDEDVIVEIVPDLSKVKAGSFEAFMGSMGDPTRWAGAR